MVTVGAYAQSNYPFNGLDMNMGNLSRLSDAKTRSISPENFTGEKGKGGMADPVSISDVDCFRALVVRLAERREQTMRLLCGVPAEAAQPFRAPPGRRKAPGDPLRHVTCTSPRTGFPWAFTMNTSAFGE